MQTGTGFLLTFILLTSVTTQGAGAKELPKEAFSVFARPLVLTPPTKIIDVRDRDAWLKERLAKSVYLNWEQFTQPGAGSRGSLRVDPQLVAEDLALTGIDIHDPVLIVGNGREGRGEEGRMAWLLMGLGMEQVTVADFRQVLRLQGNRAESGPYKPTPVKKWKARLNTSAVITAAELSAEALKKRDERALVLDVRPRRIKGSLPEFFQNFQVQRAAWRDFVDENGGANKKILETMPTAFRKDSKNRRIVVVSYAGLSSSHVTLALREWGFDAVNLAEGFSWYLPKSPLLAKEAEDCRADSEKGCD